MKERSYFKFNPQMETLIAFSTLLVAGLSVYLANLYKARLFFLFYQIIFGLGICIFYPLFYIRTIKKEPLNKIGITGQNWLHALLVALIFIVISVPGQFINKVILFPSFERLVYISSALIMSSFFEELFFRGFLQTRFEKAFGIIPAIILSGAAFSLYHLGYPNYRSISLLVIMFWVGAFFAVSFSITRNIITPFVVNLVNAIVSYILKPHLFQAFDKKIALISFFTILVSICTIAYFQKNDFSNRYR